MYKIGTPILAPNPWTNATGKTRLTEEGLMAKAIVQESAWKYPAGTDDRVILIKELGERLRKDKVR